MSTGLSRVPDGELGTQNSEQIGELSQQETAFEVLSNERRRRVVHVLLRRVEDEVPVRDLSRELAAWENGLNPEDVTLTQHKRVYTALTQSHLPRMAEHGYVEYDEERNVVRPTDRVEDLRLYLEVDSPGRIPWSACYAGVGLIGLGLVAAKAAKLFPISEVSGLGWATALALLFSASSVLHACARRRGRGHSPVSP